MPTNADPRSSTPGSLPYPIHLLTADQSQLWFINHRQIASTLVRLYPGGVGVLVWSQHLIALVNPRGAVQPLPPPHKRYPRWMIANRPAAPECVCMNFFDPEVQGAWRERGSDGHHPLCQFDKTSQAVFKIAATKAAERLGLVHDEKKGGYVRTKDVPAQERPDEWIKIREQVASQ